MISVIIPSLNEAARLPALIGQLAGQATAHEIIVVDGGSGDGSADVARRMGARVIETAPGRGEQLMRGAATARGDVLLFLHADSRFPDGGLAAIRDALDGDADIAGGNFRLLFDGDDDFSRWLDGFYAWIRGHGVYYGDSGVFVRRRVYEDLGGIRPMALMEDYHFNRRLERLGRTVCIDAPPLVSSSRRFHGRTKRAIVCGWLLIHGLYHLGVPPRVLARIYDSQRRRQRARADAAGLRWEGPGPSNAS